MFFGKFEPTLRVFVSRCLIFARHDTICSVFHCDSCSYISHFARTQRRAVIFRTVGFSRMQRFLMLSVFVSTSVSHAVELSDALGRE